MPLVSVYWISGYRGASVVRLAQEFRERTSWSNLELIVVDWSVGSDQLNTRGYIRNSDLFDQILFRDEKSCVYNNTNFARAHCRGQYVVGFEDDVRLRDEVPDSWLEFLIQHLQTGDFDDASLWSMTCPSPPPLAYVSSVSDKPPFPTYECFPARFDTISESMRKGAAIFAESYRRSGRKMMHWPIVETSLSAPSRNLSKLSDLAGYGWKKIDELVDEGVALERMNEVHFVTAEQYESLGGWEGMRWAVLGDSGTADKVRRRLSGWQNFSPASKILATFRGRFGRLGQLLKKIYSIILGYSQGLGR